MREQVVRKGGQGGQNPSTLLVIEGVRCAHSGQPGTAGTRKQRERMEKSVKARAL
ncbi:hypothetical protein GCM10017562_41130 [Streptomyces roseofulvus]